MQHHHVVVKGTETEMYAAVPRELMATAARRLLTAQDERGSCPLLSVRQFKTPAFVCQRRRLVSQLHTNRRGTDSGMEKGEKERQTVTGGEGEQKEFGIE